MDSSDFSLFISDLHLCETRPEITLQFIEFLQTTARQTESLYILGDLFEYWAGDDDMDNSHHLAVVKALNVLSGSDTRLFFLHGNRDFLIAHAFAKATGATLLADPTLLCLYGKRVLLSHGDQLCTGDIAYQAFRIQVRDPSWQQAFLSQPLITRKAYIESLRQRSEEEKSSKSMAIMDVNSAAVEALLRLYNYPEILIHGHTHRPNTHLHQIENHHCTRIVLGDWYEQGSYLKLDASGCLSQPI